MRRRFFVERFEHDSAVLRAETAEHLGRVLRAEPGQLYELSDGQQVWLARLERIALSKRGGSRIEFALVEPIEAVLPSLIITVLLSIIKFDRFEWCLEKATELGVDEIIPLAAARTDKPLVAAAGKRRERWQRILLESAQQSRRLRPPVLRGAANPQMAFAPPIEGLKILLSERREADSLSKLIDHDSPLVARALLPVRPSASASAQAPTCVPLSVTLAIGPEGGWTAEEISDASANGFLEASLGTNILRTETAVVAALAILQFAFGTS
jgi:16S rRNA (uracil1498-N3)-methyltransferase